MFPLCDYFKFTILAVHSNILQNCVFFSLLYSKRKKNCIRKHANEGNMFFSSAKLETICDHNVLKIGCDGMVNLSVYNKRG